MGGHICVMTRAVLLPCSLKEFTSGIAQRAGSRGVGHAEAAVGVEFRLQEERPHQTIAS